MLKGFRDFVMRGNVIELAVAVAIGTAFTAVVTQFGNSFIKPLVAVFAGGGAAGGTFVVQRPAVRLRRLHQRADLLPASRQR